MPSKSGQDNDRYDRGSRLFGILNRAFDGLQLLSKLMAWPILFDHLDDHCNAPKDTIDPDGGIPKRA
jgi:hypothetical protein